ncbi:Short-chain dehydrogenase/reductase SDR [Penicillium paradoxum]|uniref:Short-chain dehydrogenase/reductase SDR n=1 Tax=Penicillium paradoxum TaxID=176176 RepID=UPI0025495F17|nr:Short-chain dehydrogenase/reductase SDR [Penicillium paradoxum]KAJ5788493.1 Short-chain dehydrogenase/reductase SDR [Penicillium paradoxum]
MSQHTAHAPPIHRLDTQNEGGIFKSLDSHDMTSADRYVLSQILLTFGGEVPLVFINSVERAFAPMASLERVGPYSGANFGDFGMAYDSRALVHAIMVDEKRSMTQEAFFEELVAELEKIAPGVTSWC